MAQVDDTALRQLAARHGLTASYSIRRNGERWHVKIRARRGDEVVAWHGANGLRDPQALFDSVVEAIRERLDPATQDGKMLAFFPRHARR